MLVLVALVSCEEAAKEGEKASVCLFVGNERHCQQVDNAAELKAEIEKHKAESNVRAARFADLDDSYEDNWRRKMEASTAGSKQMILASDFYLDPPILFWATLFVGFTL